MGNSVIAVLTEAVEELRNIHRGKHYGFWREDTLPKIDAVFSANLPFGSFNEVWIQTGDGAYVQATARFGAWAIDMLVSKHTPDEILLAFEAEVSENSAIYDDASPLLGVQIDKDCRISDGITIVAEPGDDLARLSHIVPFQSMRLPLGTAVLRQSFKVKPAFEKIQPSVNRPSQPCLTLPGRDERTEMKSNVRLACILASAGAVELPQTQLISAEGALFAAGEGNMAFRAFGLLPLVTFPVEAARVKHAFEAIAAFKNVESLARSIDRLGRSRLSRSEVDRVIDLGMAAEIALMHDLSSSNTEISHKISSRAAWLLGSEPEDRGAIFREMRELYNARSTAVHSGKLSSKSRLEIENADRLVSKVLLAILEHGSFPDWNGLTLGLQPR